MGLIESAPRASQWLVVLHDFYFKWPKFTAADNVETKVVNYFLQNRSATWEVPENVVADDDLILK